MTSWFIILGFSSLVITCVAIALVVRVRRHMKAAPARVKPTLDEIDRNQET